MQVPPLLHVSALQSLMFVPQLVPEYPGLQVADVHCELDEH